MIQIIKYIFNHPLTSRQKLKALIRFLKWQLSSRLFPFPVVYPFVNQTRLVVKKGMTGATGNIYTGLHEFEDMAFTLHFLRKDDFFVDIGSNVGSYTVLASGVAEAETLSIEPIPSTFGHLLDNIAINHIGSKVKAMNIGLGPERNALFFTSSLDTVNHILNDEEKKDLNIEKIEVPVEPLDKVLNDRIPILMKIDVEGFEAEVLKGGENCFKNKGLKCIIIELNGSGRRYGYDDADVHNKILDWGFSPYKYHPFSRSLSPLDNHGNYNTIYIRDINFTEKRLKEAGGFNVLGIHI